jgi:hypothetical protein
LRLNFCLPPKRSAGGAPPFFSRKKVEEAFIIALLSGNETPLGYCNCKIEGPVEVIINNARTIARFIEIK